MPTATPGSGARGKTIHLIRHGMGYHNEVPSELRHIPSDANFDSHMNETGWAQAQDLRAHLKQQELQVELVVTSPLTRCLETASSVFKDYVIQDASTFQHRALPFLAVEMCRETLGMHACDRRRSITEQSASFPAVDFSLIESDEDVYWGPDVRESDDKLQARGQKFADWLLARPERSIAVVTHAGFLFAFVQNLGISCDPGNAHGLRHRFRNCELRTVFLQDQHQNSVAT